MKKNTMIIPTLILGFIATGLLVYGYKNGAHIQGMKNALAMTLQILPLLFFSFIISGMMQVLVSPEGLLKWVGPESGMKGIFLGTVAGALTPGALLSACQSWRDLFIQAQGLGRWLPSSHPGRFGQS